MTEAEYIANIAARFPKCVNASGLAIPFELAKRENRAMLSRIGAQRPAREVSDEARANLADLRRRDGLSTTSVMLAALTEPMTRADLSRKTGIPETTLTHALLRAREQRLVDKVTLKRMAIWHRRQEAAE